jgi:two-component system nitrate/nitrite response regulator NarL
LKLFEMERSVMVAVVDGNTGARGVLVRRLKQVPGISVVGEAGDAGEALRVVGSCRPEVVLLDFRRIAPNGAELLDRLATLAPQAGVVIITAYLTERERTDLMRAGARAILLKEIDSERLVGTIRTVAARGGALERR